MYRHLQSKMSFYVATCSKVNFRHLKSCKSFELHLTLLFETSLSSVSLYGVVSMQIGMFPV